MKTIYLLSLSIAQLCFFSSILSQTAPTIQWQKSLGGSKTDGAGGIQTTRDGGYIVSAVSFSNDGDVTGIMVALML